MENIMPNILHITLITWIEFSFLGPKCNNAAGKQFWSKRDAFLSRFFFGGVVKRSKAVFLS